MGKHALRIASRGLGVAVSNNIRKSVELMFCELKYHTARFAVNAATIVIPGGTIIMPALYLVTGKEILKPCILPKNLCATKVPGRILPDIVWYHI